MIITIYFLKFIHILKVITFRMWITSIYRLDSVIFTGNISTDLRVKSLYFQPYLCVGVYMKNKLDTDRELIHIELENESDSEETLSCTDVITSIRANYELLTDQEERQFLLRFVTRITVEKISLEGARRTVANIVNVAFSR